MKSEKQVRVAAMLRAAAESFIADDFPISTSLSSRVHRVRHMSAKAFPAFHSVLGAVLNVMWPLSRHREL